MGDSRGGSSVCGEMGQASLNQGRVSPYLAHRQRALAFCLSVPGRGESEEKQWAVLEIGTGFCSGPYRG